MQNFSKYELKKKFNTKNLKKLNEIKKKLTNKLQKN